MTGKHYAKLACAFYTMNHSWRLSDTLGIEPLYCCGHLAYAFQYSQQPSHKPHTSCFSLKWQTSLIVGNESCLNDLKSIAPSLREVAWWSIFDGEYPGMTYFGKFLSKQGTWGPETQRELHSSVSSCLAGGAASCRRCTGPSPHHQSNLKGDSICFGRLFSNTQDWYTLCFLLRWSFKYMEDFTTAWHRWHCEASSMVLWASWMCRFKALGCTNLPQSSHLCFSPIKKNRVFKT